MNNNSLLCRFLTEHPDDWELLLHREYELKIKKEGNYAIFNYNITADFSNPLVQEARGIILDYKTAEVVCWPFRKFGNYSESYADRIDWGSARVLQKIDGSIIKLWYDKEAGKWQFSTNATIRAEHAGVEGQEGLTYGALVQTAVNYGDIRFGALDTESTYLFELVSPLARVVVPYETTALYHIGTRNNRSGREYECDIGVQKPASYPLASLKDCIAAAQELNRAQGNGEILYEGFVVLDRDFHRVKVKSIDYIVQHRFNTEKTFTRKRCLELLRYHRESLGRIYSQRPELEPLLRYYDYRLSELLYDVDCMADIAARLYEEYSHDRKALAQVIGKHPLSYFGFSAVKNEKKGRELLLSQPIERWEHLIADYEHQSVAESLNAPK